MCVTPFTAKTTIYRHSKMDPWGENQNSFFPEHQQYYNVNYYRSQFYCEEPQPQYYYLQQSQAQVEGAGASMQNINSRNGVAVAESSTESSEGTKTSGKKKKHKLWDISTCRREIPS